LYRIFAENKARTTGKTAENKKDLRDFSCSVRVISLPSMKGITRGFRLYQGCLNYSR
jgi:hypothetical protein